MNDNDIKEAYRAALDKENIRAAVLDTVATEEAPRRNNYRKPVLAIAAPVLVIAVVLAIWLPGVLELKEAKAFFDENGLSTDGLTDDEIIVVYRDIETGTFAEDATVQVIGKVVPGLSYELEEMSPVELAALWQESRKAEVYYYYEAEEREAPSGFGMIPLDNSFIEKRSDDQTLWTVTLPYHMNGYQDIDAGVITYGRYVEAGNKSADMVMTLIDKDGNIGWQHDLPITSFDHIAKIKARGDMITVLTHDGRNKLSKIDVTMDGEMQNPTEVTLQTPAKHIYIDGLDDYADGFVLVYHENIPPFSPKLIRVDADGNLNYTAIQFENDDEYRVQDVITCGDRVYLSAYTFPRRVPEVLPADEEALNSNAEVVDVEDTPAEDAATSESQENLAPNTYLPQAEYFPHSEVHEIDMKIRDMDWEELMSEDNTILPELFRDYYKAVLFEIDPESGTPLTFHEVQGAFGSTLQLNASGNPVWNVEHIEKVVFSPATSAFSYSGTGIVHRFTFDQNGNLIDQQITDQCVRFFR